MENGSPRGQLDTSYFYLQIVQTIFSSPSTEELLLSKGAKQDHTRGMKTGEEFGEMMMEKQYHSLMGSGILVPHITVTVRH